MFAQKRSLFAVLSLAFLAAACGDDPVEPDDHEEEVASAVVLVNGQPAVTFQNGQPVGHLDVPVGGELDVSVRFLAADGDVVNPDPDEHFLDIAIGNTSIARFHRTTIFAGHIEGLAAGETTATVRLMHGDPASGSGHADFQTQPIQLHVE